LSTLYSADGIADAVTFDFHFGIRTAGDPTTDTAFQCPDEASGCPYTRYEVCTFNESSDQDVRVAFVLCMEEADESTTPQERMELCAPKAAFSSEQVQNIQSCYDGDSGTQLLSAAAVYFMDRFPVWSQQGYPFNVPHIFVNDEDQYGTIDSASLLAKLCAAGANAAACSSLV